ncbi:MAG TPA: hypothetical protein PKI93_06900 [Alphaproteobacteria bacterium]|nr:hypothetical protein [Alphaproteobacteria bacterium]HNS43701.1 hypothetical protein [Alphaproteobacteria bacterium]
MDTNDTSGQQMAHHTISRMMEKMGKVPMDKSELTNALSTDQLKDLLKLQALTLNTAFHRLLEKSEKSLDPSRYYMAALRAQSQCVRALRTHNLLDSQQKD